ncbi:MAG TPA: glutamyl-tRNA reductase [Dehalococcoidia bacterium]|nr:glutamyl-tRNA reductase [Dehalococcoidia bacterium]
MQVSLVGISHKTAPIAVREHFAFAPDELPGLLARLGERYAGAAVLSTCNRTEVYVVAPRGIGDPRSVIALLSEARGEPPVEGAPFFALSGKEAMRHLFRVAAGIESMVIGESEILGQVRAAFAAATVAGTHSVALSRLFHTAIRVGRKARAQTHISRYNVSVSSTAVALARTTFGDLRGRTVLVISAGEAGKIAARTLAESGVGRMLVTNRSAERAAELAADLGGRAVPFGRLERTLAEADIVITATAAPEYVIDRALAERATAARGGRPLLVIDIAVPRDVDPAVRDLPGVQLHDIDGLQEIANANHNLRKRELQQVEAIIDEEVARYAEWLRSLEVVPTVAALRARAEAVRQTELERTLARLDLSAAERKRIEAMTAAMVKRLLHDPIRRLKTSGEGERYVEAVRALFALDGDEPQPGDG